MCNTVDIITFEEKIGYSFKNKELLRTALTHSSYSRENESGNSKNNERLEFLGDAFFDAVVGEELYHLLPDSPEGDLSKLRSAVVCRKSLAEAGKTFDIGEYMAFGKSERRTGGKDKISIQADAMEAVIGAVFLDGGYEAVKKFVLEVFNDTIKRALSGERNDDYKSRLQEILMKNGIIDIKYVIEKETGPDHDKVFYAAVSINGEIRGRGIGKSKKSAEQNAAMETLKKMENR